MSYLLTNSKNDRSLERQKEFGMFPDFSSWFDDILGNDPAGSDLADHNKGITLPSVNIKEDENSYFIEMAVPGMKKSDFKIDVENHELTISSEVEETQETKNERYTRREFRFGSFKRTFTMPDTIDTDNISASYDDGVLNVALPKKEEAKEKPARTIEIS